MAYSGDGASPVPEGRVRGRRGEFSFGVPQFPQLFQPPLISMAAGLGPVAIRVVLGPGRAVVGVRRIGGAGAPASVPKPSGTAPASRVPERV